MEYLNKMNSNKLVISIIAFLALMACITFVLPYILVAGAIGGAVWFLYKSIKRAISRAKEMKSEKVSYTKTMNKCDSEEARKVFDEIHNNQAIDVDYEDIK